MFQDLVAQLMGLPSSGPYRDDKDAPPLNTEGLSKRALGLCAYKDCMRPRHVGKNGPINTCIECCRKRNKRAWEKRREKAAAAGKPLRVQKNYVYPVSKKVTRVEERKY
jgi:hypothetical protein